MRWLAVGTWMAVIFFFSAQSGVESKGLSTYLVDLLTASLPALDPVSVSLIVRKSAHVLEYAILGALLTWALPIRSLSTQILLPIALGTLYAISDEVHQVFVPGRAGQVGDVVIDSLGVTASVLLMVFAARWHYIGGHVRHDGADHSRSRTVREEQ